MDYGKVLKRAWEITWRWKVLWILGFLVALGNGAGSSSGSSYTTDSSDWSGMYFDYVPPEIIALIAGLVCLGLIVGIAIWVVSTIARGGLIAGVQQVEDEETTSFGQAWRAGASRFWTLIGIGVLSAIPMIILFLVGIITLVLAIAGGVAFADVVEEAVLAIIIPSVFCGGILCCGAIIAAVILAQIRIYAERAAVLEGLGWIDAFKRGWQVLKDNLGHTIVFWLIFFAIGIAIAAVIAGVMMVMFFPFIAIMFSSDQIPWIAGMICCLGPLGIIVAALISAIIETFSSATWTLAYREMTATEEPVIQEPVVEELDLEDLEEPDVEEPMAE